MWEAGDTLQGFLFHYVRYVNVDEEEEEEEEDDEEDDEDSTVLVLYMYLANLIIIV